MVAVPPESRFIVELWEGKDQIERRRWLDALAAHKRFHTWDLPIEAVAGELADAEMVSYADAVRAAFRAYAAVHGKPRWGDKTPRYVEKLSFVARLLPEAKIVHLIRDGRNVALSYADVDFGPKTIGGAARIWAERVSAGTRAGRTLGPERYHELHYESLVANADAAVRELCVFLELPFDEGMLNYTRGARDALLTRAHKFNPHLAEGTVHEVRSWENDMPRRHVEIFEAVAGRVLSESGYVRMFDHPRAAARAAGWIGARGLPLARLRGGRDHDEMNEKRT